MLLRRSKVMISNSEHDDQKKIGRVDGMQKPNDTAKKK